MERYILLLFSLLSICKTFGNTDDYNSYLKYINKVDSIYETKNYDLIIDLSLKIQSKYDKDCIEYCDILKNLAVSYYHKKEIEKANEVASNCLEIIFSNASNYMFSSYVKRKEITQNYIIPIIDWCQSILLMSKLTIYNEDIYNASLFKKNVLLKSESEFQKIVDIITPEDIEIVQKYYNPDNLTAIEDLILLYSKVAPFFPNFTSFLKIRMDNIQFSLTKYDVVIEFVENVIDNQIYALILRHNYNYPIVLPICHVDSLIECMNVGSQLYDSNNSPQLYSLIWKKILPYCQHVENIFFSPTSVLHLLNIEMLHNENREFLDECYNVFRVSSTREIAIIHPEINYDSAVLYGGLTYDVDADSMEIQSKRHDYNKMLFNIQKFNVDTTNRNAIVPLEYSYWEIDNITDVLNIDKKISPKRYTGIEGNEESFKSLSDKHISIIHLATHGFYLKQTEVSDIKYYKCVDNTTNPLNRTGLIFAGGQNAWLGKPIPQNIEDGILLASEIENINLIGTGLLVLSACQTGLGEFTSESIYGLQRSFKKAGVQSILMSLWNVNDFATHLLMTKFYENLMVGKPKREALLNAQKEIREYYPNDPDKWASFIILDALN